MNYLLIAGAPSVRKSQSIYRLVRALLASNKFFVMVGNFPSTFCDFKIILEGSFDNKSYKRILINSATDTTAIIDDL